MDNVELSPATRWGMIATGLLQGLVCYLLIAWLAGKNLCVLVGIGILIPLHTIDGDRRVFIRFTLLRDLL